VLSVALSVGILSLTGQWLLIENVAKIFDSIQLQCGIQVDVIDKERLIDTEQDTQVLIVGIAINGHSVLFRPQVPNHLDHSRDSLRQMAMRNEVVSSLGISA